MFDPEITAADQASSSVIDLDPLLTALRSFAVWDSSDATEEELLTLAPQTEVVRRILDSFSCRVLAELESRGSTDSVDGMRTGPWLAHLAKLPVGPTKARVRVATKLRTTLPQADSALAEGLISYEHAKVLAEACNPRISESFAAVVPDLIQAAQHSTFDRWRKEVAGLAELLDADGGHTPGDCVSDNKLSMSRGLENTLQLNGQLCGQFGLSVEHAINTRADQIFKRMQADQELTPDLTVPHRSTLRALALWELIRESGSTDLGCTQAPVTELSLVVQAQDAQTVTDSEGLPIGNTDQSTLLCDPVFRAVVTTVHGIVLALGRDQRLANRAQRRAIAHRDGGCVWPGCTHRPAWTDAHHIQHWQHGGSTEPSNLASLCRYHHMVTHRNGWNMQVTDDQWFWWTSPTGQRFWSQRHGKQRAGPLPN